MRRVSQTRGDHRNHGGAESEPDQEQSEHQAEGVGERAHEQAQQARPGDLVTEHGESTRTRGKETDPSQTVPQRFVDRSVGNSGLVTFRSARLTCRSVRAPGLHRVQGQREQSHRGEKERGGISAARDTEVLEREETGQEDTGGRSESVEPVEQAQRTGETIQVPDHEATQGGECAAHEYGGNQQQREREGELERALESRRVDRPERCEKELSSVTQQQHQQRAGDGGPQFEQTIEPQGALGPVGQLAHPDGAQGEAGHESREHQRRRDGAAAEEPDQLSQEDDLEDEAAHPGKDE